MSKDKSTNQVIFELRDTLSRMELSLSAINDAIVWIDESRKIKWCNEKFNKLVKLPYIQILARPLNTFLSLKLKGQPVKLTKSFFKPAKKNNHKNNIYEISAGGKSYAMEIFINSFASKNTEPTTVIVLHDVTESQRALEKINFLASFPENNDAPILTITENNELIYANHPAQKLIERWRKRWQEKVPREFIALKDQSLINKKSLLIEKSYGDTTYLFNITPASNYEYVNIYGTNITERKRSEEQIIYLSSHDMLTNLYNRKAFEDILKNVIDSSKRTNTSFAVLMIDLDNFKSVNDTFGHHIGDQLLVNVADQLRHSVRSTDIIARLGGDEFVILIPNITNQIDVQRFAENLINRFNKPFVLDGYFFRATVSIGIALSSAATKDSSAVIKNADIALYAVKELGKNNFQFFSDEVSSIFQRRTRLESSLPIALEKGEFFLVYQPQYKIPKKEVVGLEALVRWQHPEMGLILPNDFIPLAERNGFIVKMGEWILRTACSQYMKWQSQRVIPKGLKLAVNISPKQLADSNFYNSFLQIIEDTGMEIENLDFEISESAVMASIINLDPILEKLRTAGISISIDDFGAGYSSLSRLKMLPVNALKIDKSFIANLARDPEDALIVKSIIALGNSLGLIVIPEGVETAKQLDILIQFNCKIVQGFYFGKEPIKAEEMTTFLKDNAVAH